MAAQVRCRGSREPPLRIPNDAPRWTARMPSPEARTRNLHVWRSIKCPVQQDTSSPARRISGIRNSLFLFLFENQLRAWGPTGKKSFSTSLGSNLAIGNYKKPKGLSSWLQTPKDAIRRAERMLRKINNAHPPGQDRQGVPGPWSRHARVPCLRTIVHPSGAAAEHADMVRYPRSANLRRPHWCIPNELSAAARNLVTNLTSACLRILRVPLFVNSMKSTERPQFFRLHRGTLWKTRI
jgi:hypothetical protein